MMFDWDAPFLNIWLLCYLMAPSLIPLLPGLGLAAWAGRLGRGKAEIGGDGGVDGSTLARSILDAAGQGGVAIVAASGPLANFYDPWRREVRLSKAIREGRTPGALGMAAHISARAIQDSAYPHLFRVATTLRLGLRLGIGAAWIVVLSGLLIRSQTLSYRGAMLELAGVVGSLVLLPLDLWAHRRLLDLGPSTAPIVEDPAARGALDAASWADLAANVPLWRRAR